MHQLSLRSLLLGLLLTTAVYTLSHTTPTQADEITAVTPVAETAVSTTTQAICPTSPTPRALLAGDSWAQYMWDDGVHNELLDKYGHADKQLISQSLSADPGPGYSGTAYAVSGSEARNWVDSNNYPYLANMVTALNANPTVDLVVLSVGGNDILAGKPDGGWYKDMDLDAPGSETAVFNLLQTNTNSIINAALAVRPNINLLLSSYDYPNFNVGSFWCLFEDYACRKPRELSRDPDNDLITDAELNGMMVTLEQQRIGWTNANSRLSFDNGVGLMHYYYGDGQSGPGTLPFPGQTPPNYAPFPGGNPALPTLRENFRLAPDPIHLDAEGYEYKVSHQIQSFFLPHFRTNATATFFAAGGSLDGWTTGSSFGTNGIYLGDDGTAVYHGLLTFDTSSLPNRARVTSASLYLLRNGASGSNPFQSGALGQPTVDVASGSFGAPTVELSDATAPATASDAGCLYGSAAANSYAVRADLLTNGLDAINSSGTTQFRLAFPNANANVNRVSFNDGDAVLAAPQVEQRTESIRQPLPDGSTRLISRQIAALPLPSLASYIGSAKPFLDVDYCLVPETAVITPTTLPTLTWNAADANEYEVWTAINDPYFQPGGSCEQASNCVVISNPSLTMQTLGNATSNTTYTIISRNGCGSASATTIAEFDFTLQPGS